jgi:DNA-binding CsgD family transcriptional regulator
MKAGQEDKVYTVLQVSRILDLTPTTIRSYVKTGKLRAEGKPLLISEDSLRSLLP